MVRVYVLVAVGDYVSRRWKIERLDLDVRSGWSDKGEGVGGGIETELSTEQRTGVL